MQPGLAWSEAALTTISGGGAKFEGPDGTLLVVRASERVVPPLDYTTIKSNHRTYLIRRNLTNCKMGVSSASASAGLSTGHRRLKRLTDFQRR